MLLFIILSQMFNFASIFAGNSVNKVRLIDVQTLTLYKNQYTTGRRSSPVPQLQCLGGTAGCDAVKPDVVQCYNRGSDGSDVQWECKCDMDNAYKFGSIQVTCEGYDYPNDPDILKGSCGLEYTIDYNSQQYGKQSSDSTYYPKSPKRSSWLADIIFWVIIALFLLILYRIFIAPGGPSGSTRAPGSSGGGPWGGGGGGGGGPGGAPPPSGPGFRPEFYPDDSCSGGSSYPGGYTSTSRGGYGQGPGFWTGLGAGGLLGYLMGNRGNDNYGYRRSNWGSPGPSGSSSSSWGSPSSTFGGAGTSRSASGFGGTRRR